MTAKNFKQPDGDRGDRISRDLHQLVQRPRSSATEAAEQDTKSTIERHRRELREAVKKLTNDA